MRNVLNFNYFRLLIIAGFMTWAVNVSGQSKNLAIGAGVGYNMTPLLEYDYDDYWDHHSWEGNFTPSLTLRYGNKISGVFKASYILNIFEYDNFRFGFYKVPVNLSYTEDARMIAIQFILGYLRRL